jgi:very-short-patch-repair endonuclease
MSKLEEKFEFMWRVLGGPKMEREHHFHPERRWRFDFALPAKKMAIEIEGGTWVKGAHSRGKHYASDCEKYNHAGMLGWRVFRFTTDMLGTKHMEPVIKEFNKKT